MLNVPSFILKVERGVTNKKPPPLSEGPLLFSDEELIIIPSYFL